MTAQRDAGELAVLGMDPDREPRDLKARMGVVPQEINLDLELTVLENMLVYGRYFGMRRDDARARALELLRFVDLHERTDETVRKLQGSRKETARHWPRLAPILAHGPRIGHIPQWRLLPRQIANRAIRSDGESLITLTNGFHIFMF